MDCRIKIISILLIFPTSFIYSQNFSKKYEEFKKEAHQDYAYFRDECNQKYADFLRTAWDWYQGKAPMPIPKEKNPVPSRLYKPINEDPIAVEPAPVKPVEPKPQPKPISPI